MWPDVEGRKTPFTGQFPTYLDSRGSLGVAEFSSIPFVPLRFFWIFGVSQNETRANHAHRNCEQLIFVQQGSSDALVVDQSRSESRWNLNAGEWLYLPPRHWLQLLNFETGTILGVFASLPYDRDEYIDNIEDLSS